MAEYGVKFAKNFSLNEALAMLEDDEEYSQQVDSLTIFPPKNSWEVVTDEDSGDEDFVSPNNLPGSQLQAPVEINLRNDEFSSEDEIPLSVLKGQTSSETQPKSKRVAKKKKTYSWIESDLTSDSDSSNFNILQENFASNIETPLELFSYFFDDELLEIIVRESNRYAAQHNRNIVIDISEIKAWIGVVLLSGYIQVPRRRMYWEYERDSQNSLVTEAISRNKFEYILSNFHVIDNSTLTAGDKFAKVRPLFNHLNQKFLEYAPLEEMHCVDEAMVPYFGRHGCKQFIHGKPIRYGYKLWVGATRLGYVNWFEPYQGASTNISTQYVEYGVGPSVVLEYSDVLRKKWPDAQMHIFFDNFFSTIALLEALSSKNFKATGTIRENRILNSPLLDSKMMKKEKRGCYDYKKIEDQNIIALKWHDNSVVALCSNSAGVNPVHSVKRFSQKEKKVIQVPQPHIVNLYNANMGGVDRSDQNLSLYRTSIRGKKWYFSLITHCIDLAVNNAWQLHRKKGGQLDQLKFRRRIAVTILSQNKKLTTSKGHMSAQEGIDIRFDRVDHYVIPQEKQTRCALCHERAKTRCQKCNKGLHVKCFVEYHTKTNN